jgi:hypothetical protein
MLSNTWMKAARAHRNQRQRPVDLLHYPDNGRGIAPEDMDKVFALSGAGKTSLVKAWAFPIKTPGTLARRPD